MKYLLIFPIVCSLLFQCRDASSDVTEITERERKQIESDVINRFHAMIKYAEAGELENVISHFDLSGPGSYIDGGVRYATLEEMLVHYRATWKIARQDYGIPVTTMHIISPRHVLLTSTSVLNTTNREGITFQPRPWATTLLWTLKGDEWVIHSFHQFEGEAKPLENKSENK